jgi:hypothetical protein
MKVYKSLSYFTERDPLSFPSLKQPQPFPEDLLVPIPVLEEPRTRWEKFRDEIVKELQKRRWRGGPGYYEDFRNWGEQYTPRNDEQAIQQIQVFKEGKMNLLAVKISKLVKQYLQDILESIKISDYEIIKDRLWKICSKDSRILPSIFKDTKKGGKYIGGYDFTKSIFDYTNDEIDEYLELDNIKKFLKEDKETE